MNTPSVFFWSITDTSVEYNTLPTDLRCRVLRTRSSTIVPADHEFLDADENEILQLARCVTMKHALYRFCGGEGQGFSGV